MKSPSVIAGAGLIERERDAGMARDRRDRDTRDLDQAMTRLDADEREPCRPREVEGVPAADGP